jgi:excisionase family DNA binding protein
MNGFEIWAPIADTRAMAASKANATASGSDRYSALPPVLDLVQAAALLGLGRTTAYRLVQDNQWPTPVLRLGRLIKIPTQPLLDLLAGKHPIATMADGQR